MAEPTSGSMPGADMLTGWVSGSSVEIQDRYSTKKILPTEDDCSHWKLVSGQEVDGVTVIEVRRLLDTQDSQDRPFVSGLTKVIN